MQSSTPPAVSNAPSPTLQQLAQQQQHHQQQHSSPRAIPSSPAPSSLVNAAASSASMHNAKADSSNVYSSSRDTNHTASRKASAPSVTFQSTTVPTPPDSLAGSARSTPSVTNVSGGGASNLSAAAPQFQTRRAVASEAAPIDLRGLALPVNANRPSHLGRAVNLPTLKNPQGEVLDLTMFSDGLSACFLVLLLVDPHAHATSSCSLHCLSIVVRLSSPLMT